MTIGSSLCHAMLKQTILSLEGLSYTMEDEAELTYAMVCVVKVPKIT
jgi:hypothetical protein